MGLFSVGGQDVAIKVGLNAEDAIKGVDSLGSKLKSFTGIAAGLGAAFGGAVVGLGAMTLKLAAAGENLGSLEAGFTALGGSFGTIDTASEKVLGLVSRTDLLGIANKALVQGLPDVNENFGDIADLGARLANTLGTDVKGSIEGLTSAIARGVPRQLQQYGIIVDSEKAYHDFAKANGIAANSLNETAKKMAMQEAAMRQVKERLGEVAEVSDSLTNATTRLQNKFQDKIDIFGKSLNENEKLTGAMDELSKVVDAMDFSVFEELLEYAASAAISIATNLIPTIENFVLGIKFAYEWVQQLGDMLKNIGEVGVNVFKGIGNSVKSASKDLVSFVAGNKIAENMFGPVTDGLEDMNKALSASYKVEMPSFTRASLEVLKQTDFFEKKTKDATRAIEGQQGVIEKKAVPNLTKLGDASKEAAKAQHQLLDITKHFQDQMASEQISKFVGNMSDKFKEGEISLQKFTSEMEEFRKGLVDLGVDLKIADQEIGKVNLFENLNDQVSDAKLNFSSQDFSAELGANIAEGFENFDTTTAIAGIGVLGQKAIEQLGEQTSGWGALIGGVIGGALAAIFSLGMGAAGGAAIGAVVGELGESLIMSMNLWGGSKQHQTVGRRNVEAYFDEVFKHTDFYIRQGGQFVRFDDLILGSRHDFAPGTDFMNAIAEYPMHLRNAFRGLGGAIAQQFGEDFIAGTQVGDKLALAFGGDIDALKIVVLELGMTFEDFRESMEDAFFAGSISALEYNSIIRDSREAFEEGLVGIGMYEKAFQNFIDSNGKGRLAIKSLKDMVVEFREVGGSTLQGFQDALLSSGNFTEEQINMLFEALKNRGVESLDALSDASNDTLIGVTGDLQAAGFAFAGGFEEAIEEVKKVRNELEQLPKNIESNVRINVSARYDNDNTRQIYESITKRGGVGLGDTA